MRFNDACHSSTKRTIAFVLNLKEGAIEITGIADIFLKTGEVVVAAVEPRTVLPPLLLLNESLFTLGVLNVLLKLLNWLASFTNISFKS